MKSLKELCAEAIIDGEIPFTDPKEVVQDCIDYLYEYRHKREWPQIMKDVLWGQSRKQRIGSIDIKVGNHVIYSEYIYIDDVPLIGSPPLEFAPNPYIPFGRVLAGLPHPVGVRNRPQQQVQPIERVVFPKPKLKQPRWQHKTAGHYYNKRRK